MTEAMSETPAALGPGFQARLTLRLVAPLTFMVVLNSLDRVNVSYAALQMNCDLGMSPAAYGFGISVFFFGYVLLQYPCVLSQKLIGARAWIFATVFIWGVTAAAMAFMHGAPGFYMLRFLLGAAEGGFAPGVVYYMSQWAPRRYRGWAVAGTMLAIPISVVLGAPLSGWLMSLTSNPLGLPGWRFMLLMEGIAPILIAFASLAVFTNRLEDARWLTPAEKVAVRRALDEEAAEVAAQDKGHLLSALLSPQILSSIVMWFALMAGSYGLLFWMPQAVKQASTGASDFTAAALSALPWAAIGIGMMTNAWHSDRAQERRLHFAVPAALCALCLAGAASGPPPLIALACVVLGGLMLGSAQGTFWPIPVSRLGAASASGIAVINIVGNSAGLVSPLMIGWIRGATGSFALATYAMAGLMLLAAVVALPATAPVRPKDAAE